MKQLDSKSGTASMHSSAVLAIIGFIVVACMFSTNIIVARANAGEIPSFSLAFFRWMTVAFGLVSFAVREIREKWSVISPRIRMVAVAGFCGMFLCGGPVYAAAVTTTGINIGLIMAATPVNVFLIAWCFGLEKIKAIQLLSVVVALAGVALILFRGSLETLSSVNFVPGDILALIAMLGWTAYNLLDCALCLACLPSRALAYTPPQVRPSAFRYACARHGRIHRPCSRLTRSSHISFLRLSRELVRMLGLHLGAKFGSVRASLITYVMPISVVVLSILFG